MVDLLDYAPLVGAWLGLTSWIFARFGGTKERDLMLFLLTYLIFVLVLFTSSVFFDKHSIYDTGIPRLFSDLFTLMMFSTLLCFIIMCVMHYSDIAENREFVEGSRRVIENISVVIAFAGVIFDLYIHSNTPEYIWWAKASHNYPRH